MIRETYNMIVASPRHPVMHVKLMMMFSTTDTLLGSLYMRPRKVYEAKCRKIHGVLLGNCMSQWLHSKGNDPFLVTEKFFDDTLNLYAEMNLLSLVPIMLMAALAVVVLPTSGSSYSMTAGTHL